MSTFAASATGYFGKLPARADFVRCGLPEDFVAAWDSWCRNMLNASRESLGISWEDAWMQAPIWRFLLPPGVCGPHAALGVWLPSIDKAGRHFPFMAGALAPSVNDLEQGGTWLEVAEAVALSGVVDDAPHETFEKLLAAEVANTPLPAPGWWTQGSPLVQPCRLDISTLVPRSFASGMLRDAILAEPL